MKKHKNNKRLNFKNCYVHYSIDVKIITIFLCLVGFALIGVFIYLFISGQCNIKDFFIWLVITLLISSIGTYSFLQVFRFGVWFKDSSDKIIIRKALSKKRTYEIKEIRKVFLLDDSKSTLIVLCIGRRKIYVNRNACEDTIELEAFLRAKLSKSVWDKRRNLFQFLSHFEWLGYF